MKIAQDLIPVVEEIIYGLDTDNFPTLSDFEILEGNNIRLLEAFFIQKPDLSLFQNRITDSLPDFDLARSEITLLAIEEKDWEGALYCQKMEKKFICDHLIKWIPTFCDKIISQAEISFYGDLADVTKDFITLEFEEIDGSISATEGQVN